MSGVVAEPSLAIVFSHLYHGRDKQSKGKAASKRWRSKGLGFLLAFMYQSGSPYSHHVIEKREFTYANTPFPLSLWTNLAKVIRTMMHTSSSKLPTDLTSAMALAMPTNLMDSYYLVAID
jgi:hypothetical protein